MHVIKYIYVCHCIYMGRDTCGKKEGVMRPKKINVNVKSKVDTVLYCTVLYSDLALTAGPKLNPYELKTCLRLVGAYLLALKLKSWNI